MIRQMIDIETLSAQSSALILSIGGCRFNEDSLEISDKFLYNIDFKGALHQYPGKFHVDPETVEWWKKQDVQLWNSMMKNQLPIEDVTDRLYQWLIPTQEIWCWGMSFDIPILDHTFRVVGKPKSPWKYQNQRCARTVASIFGMTPDRDVGNRHDALDDSIAQAKLMMEILKT